jgi:hypothetical protein
MFSNSAGDGNGKSSSGNNCSNSITDLQRSIRNTDSQWGNHLQLDAIYQPECNDRFERNS